MKKSIIQNPQATKKLSGLQKFILKETKKNKIMKNSDILIKRYNFEQTYYGKIRFDRQRIGYKRYLSATVAVSRSLTRLRRRGLLMRNPKVPCAENCLTKRGHLVLKYLP